MIPYGRQSINEADIRAVTDAMRGEFLTTGPLVAEFEKKIEQVVGLPVVTVSSGTAALHCAYAGIGLEAGDEVITPPLTFVATQATAVQFGAKIIFADIDSETGNIDPRAVEAAITTRTKAIVAVDYAGHPAELETLNEIASRNGLFLVEDAAHSIGSNYHEQPVGSLADVTTFSFFPTKNLTTGEGGAIAAKSSAILERVKRFSRQGLIRDTEKFYISDQGPWHQEVHEFGLNYRLPDILCALGISQISRLGEFKQKREEIYDYYIENLQNLNLLLPTRRENVKPMWHFFPIRVEKSRRLDVFNKLRLMGIGVQVNYMPAYWHPVFTNLGYQKGICPNAEEYFEMEISLPMHYGLTQCDLELIVESVASALN